MMRGNENSAAHDETGLGNAAELERFAESRRNLSADPWRPTYHFVSPERTLNDPNGLCFWQGRWHLFYQAQPAGKPAHGKAVAAAQRELWTAGIASVTMWNPNRWPSMPWPANL